MADIQTSTWSETAASNNASPPDGAPEGWAPSSVNNWGREVMGAVKREWNRSHPTVTSGGTNTVTLTYTTVPAAYVQGQMHSWIVGTTNTGAATLNVNGLGAKAIRLANLALSGGEMVTGQIVLAVYDGTNFQIISPSGNFAPGTLSSYAGFKNALINGDFEIWQRGAGGSASVAQVASTTGIGPDRWYLLTQANQASVMSQQAGLTSGSRFSGRVQRNSGQTGTGTTVFAQALTTDAIIPLRGKIVTMSGWVSSGANWSPTSGNLRVVFFAGTGAEAKRAGGFTSEVTIISQTIALTAGSSATFFSFTSAAVVPTNVTQGEFHFEWDPTGTASTNDWVQFDEIQMESGPASTFDRRPFGVELNQCQRFYWKSFPYATAPAQSGGVAGGITVKNPIALGDPSAYVQYPTRMRISPTVTTYNPSASNANWRDITAAADSTVSVDPGSTKSETGIHLATSGTVTTLGDILAIHLQADAEV